MNATLKVAMLFFVFATLTTPAFAARGKSGDYRAEHCQVGQESRVERRADRRHFRWERCADSREFRHEWRSGRREMRADRRNFCQNRRQDRREFRHDRRKERWEFRSEWSQDWRSRSQKDA